MNKDKSDEIEILTDSPVTDNKNNSTEEILTDIPVSNGVNNNIEIKKTATIKSESDKHDTLMFVSIGRIFFF